MNPDNETIGRPTLSSEDWDIYRASVISVDESE
jgi:hypothetical protein